MISNILNSLNDLKIDANQYLVEIGRKEEVIERFKNNLKEAKAKAAHLEQKFSILDFYASAAHNVKDEEIAIIQIGIYAIAYDDLELNGW